MRNNQGASDHSRLGRKEGNSLLVPILLTHILVDTLHNRAERTAELATRANLALR